MTMIDVTPRPPVQGFAQDVLAAARDNPLSAALIGMGAAWMMIRGREASILRGAGNLGQATAFNLAERGRHLGAAVSSLASVAAEKGHAGGVAVASRASEAGETSAEQLRSLVPDGTSASSLKAALNEGAGYAVQRAGSLASVTRDNTARASGEVVELLDTARNKISDLLQTNPLALGAIGLAIGAGVAAALPRIQAEDALIEPVTAVRDDVRQGLSAAFGRAAEEARGQGLTPEAVSAAVSDLRGKVREFTSDMKA